ncbi:MAG: GGDEF domain-containing protein, partial [Thermohalobaculum sp.]|nr:GGDEF domain-containing protein [Thermohalobaculum sp.]
MVGGASAGGGQGPAVDLEAEPRALSRRMGAVLGASVAILVLIAFADFVATRWLGAIAAREARVASLLLEQRALAGEMLLAGAGRDGPAAARFAANRRLLSEGDAARGLPPPGDDGLGAILFRAPHNLGQAMARFTAGPGQDPAGAHAMLAALELAHGVAADGAARAARLRDQAGAGFAIGLLAALAGIALSLFRPMVRLVFAQMRRLVAAHDAVQHAAFHDPATGLPNRDSLLLQLDLALGDPGLDGQILGIVEVHLMRFEIETGPLGHAAAEAALAEMAARLATMRQGDDIVARLGGAAFAAVFTDVLDDAELAMRAGRVAERLAEPVVFGDALLCLGPTVGAAAATGGRMLAGQALAAAGMALARARQAGVGAVEVTGAETVLERIAASYANGRDPDAAAAPRDRTGAHPRRQIALARRRREAGDAAATAEAALRFTPLIELASGRIWAVVLEDAGGGLGLPARPHADAGAAVAGIPGPAVGAPPGAASRDERARLAALRCLAEWHGRGIAPAVLGLPIRGAELRQ